MNDTECSNVHDSASPNTIQAHDNLGTLSEGQVIDIYWTIYFDFVFPVGQFNIVVFLDGDVA